MWFHRISSDANQFWKKVYGLSHLVLYIELLMKFKWQSSVNNNS